MVNSHGIGMWFFHRPELLKSLYDTLSDIDKACIKTGKEVIDIETTRDGVKVLCADGSSEQGSIVIGADGVSSIVRDIMRRRALQDDPDAAVNDEKPFLATYRAMWGTVPMIQDMTGSESWDTRGSGQSAQLFLGRGRGWFFVYEKLDKPTRDWKSYNQEDKDEYARKFADLPMTDTVRFREIYAASHSSGMSDLGEGMLKILSWNRIALVGDAATKHAPNFGLGFNSGVQDVVGLVNRLRLLVRNSGDRSIDATAIRQVFQSYELARQNDARRCLQTAAAGARLHAWDSWKIWFSDRYVVPLKGTNKQIFAMRMSDMFRRGLVLDFLTENQIPSGTMSWVHHPDQVE
jgi:2-polyprenyl-6-methoxyphenol hydroxylase-like FAD-dependent oxidoreductase